MNIKKITSDIIEMIVKELKEEENMNKVKKEILRPIINYILEQIYPYLIISVIIFVLTFLIAAITLIFIVRGYTNN
jgi:uncharacterized membrane protein